MAYLPAPRIITAVSENAFKDNIALKKVTIGSNVKTIEAGAFANCRNLNKVTYKGSGLKEIKKNAFKNCIKLTKITVGKNITSIGRNAFGNCKKLKSITFKTTKLKKIDKKAFKGINNKCKIIVPKKQFVKYKKMIKKSGISSKVKVVKK